jgi:hypothetical protein
MAGVIDPGRREKLLAELQRIDDECETLPSMDDVAELSCFPLEAYVAEFGSYPAALDAAGLETEIFTRGSAASNTKLIRDLQAFAEELGHRPSRKEMDERGPHSGGTYYNRFGSWNAAIEEAGFDVWEPESIPDEELLAALRDLGDPPGVPPTSVKMAEEGPYSALVYQERFGSWSDALEAAGYENTNPKQLWSDEEILSGIRELADDLGRPPTSKEMNERGVVSAVTVWKRFGSWTDALELAGFDVDEQRYTYTEDELLDAIRTVTEDLGRWPTTSEFSAHAPMHASTVQDRFGSWTEALDAAGVRNGVGGRRETGSGNGRTEDANG